jgi:hypothetical protein
MIYTVKLNLTVNNLKINATSLKSWPWTRILIDILGIVSFSVHGINFHPTFIVRSFDNEISSITNTRHCSVNLLRLSDCRRSLCVHVRHNADYHYATSCAAFKY